MIRDAEYMRNIHLKSIDSELDEILEAIEREAVKGESHIKLYMGNSDEDRKQLVEKMNLITNKLKYLGFTVDRDFSIEWRFLSSNLTRHYLKVYW